MENIFSVAMLQFIILTVHIVVVISEHTHIHTHTHTTYTHTQRTHTHIHSYNHNANMQAYVIYNVSLHVCIMIGLINTYSYKIHSPLTSKHIPMHTCTIERLRRLDIISYCLILDISRIVSIHELSGGKNVWRSWHVLWRYKNIHKVVTKCFHD